MAVGSRSGGRMVPRAIGVARAGAPYGLGLVLGILALGPALAPGFTLAYDMVFVPDPPITAVTFGLTGTLPRAVPSDAVVALLSTVLPADLAQKALLLAIFVLATAGAARLVDDLGVAGAPRPGDDPGVLGAPRPADGTGMAGAPRPGDDPGMAGAPRPGDGTGMARALRPAGGGALAVRLAAGAFYAWNPFVAERLLIGQWAFLLGYAGLPWAVRAAAGLHRRGGVAALARALIPAAIGGFTPMIVTAITILPVALCSRPGPVGRRDAPPRAGLAGQRLAAAFWSGGKALAACGVLALPWLVPSLWRPGGVAVDPAGVAAFAARADTPFGGLGSLFLLGGIWNAEAVPRGYGDLFVSILRLLIALASVAAFALLIWTRLIRTRAAPSESGADRPMVGLGVAAGVGFGIACLGLSEPGRAVLRALIGWWPGFAVLRDAQQYVAPLALLQAVGFAALVALAIRPARDRAARAGAARGGVTRDGAARDRAARDGAARDGAPRWQRERAGGNRVGWVFAVFGVVAPVLLVPSLAWGAGGRLGAAEYPGEWQRVRAIVADDPVPGDVLALPWAAHRRYPWNEDRTVLDPMPRFLPRRVVAEDAVQVGDVRLQAEDPRARAVPTMLAGDGDLTERLRANGFRYVIVDAGGPPMQNVFHQRLKGATRVHDGPQLTAYRLVTPASYTEKGPPAWAVGTGFGITFAAILWCLAISGSSLLPRSRVLREESL